MAQRIKAFGQILEFPDDMSDDDMLKHIKSNEADLNPDYSPPVTDRIKSFAKDSLGINTDALLKRNMSIADQAEASVNEGENLAAPQVPGAPVRQSTYNKALITPGIKGKPGITSRIASTAAEDIKGQENQQELELLRTEALKPSESGFASSAISTVGRTIKGAGQIGSDFLSQDKNNAITQYGQKLLDDNPVWVKKLEDIKDEPFLAFKEATGNSVGSMAGMIGIAGLGAGITSLAPLSGPAAPVIAAVGQAVQWLGPAAVAALPSYSSIRDAQGPKFEDDAKSKAIAAMGAAAVGAIEVAFGPQQWALAMLTKEGRAAMARKFASTSVGEAAIKGALVGGAQEGFEEIPQNMLEQLASYEDPTTRSNILDTLHSGAMGAIGGTGPGGVAAVASQINTNRTQRAMSDISEADTVDDAIKVAGEAVSKKTVTPDDILKTVDPTLEDVINETQTAEEILTEQPETEISNPNDNVIITPDGTRLNAVWDVVDADEVKASLTKGVNQPRDRKRAAANVQVQRIANAPDYKRLRDSPVMDAGAPTLSLDKQIIAGNGRFEGVSLAYDQGTANPYLDEMRADVISKGLDPAIIEGKGKPILVRRLVDNHDVRKLAIKSNSGLSMDMSPIELASVDAERMVGVENLALNDLGEVALTPSNMTTLKDVFNDYDEGEMNSMADKHFNLSQSGRIRIRNAMLAKAYGDSPTLEKLIESTDSDMRNVMSALVKSVGHVLKSKKDTTSLLEAVDTYSQLKATGQPVDNFLAQQDAFSEGLSPEAASILTFIDANARSQKKLTDFFKGNFREVDTTSADMFSSSDTPQRDLRSVEPKPDDPIKLYRGVKKGNDNVDTVGGGLFYSPDRKVAEMYAGKDGQVSETSRKFDKLLSAKNWVEAKKTLGLNNANSMSDLINTARDKGYDGITFNTTNGIEYIDLIKLTKEQQLEKHLKENGYDFAVRPASVRNVDALDSTKKAHKELAEKQAKVFGKKVVFIEADGPFGINGVMVPGIKDTIFVDIRTSKPFHAVMGHELSHWMEVEKPDVYKDMVKSLKTVIKGDAAEYAKKYGIDGATKAEITKEIVGDIMGDNFTEQSFWDKVASANPEAFKDIATAIIKWLKGIIVKAKSQGMGSEAWVKDAVKAQDIVAQAVAKYTGENKATTEGGVKFHKAFHGSPHDHSKFDSTKIGTGEGAQAYGYGHYFAESKDVAEFYRKNLSNDSRVTSLTNRMELLKVGNDKLWDRYDIEPDALLVDQIGDGAIDAAVEHAEDRLDRWVSLAADETYEFRDYASDKVKAWTNLIPELKAGNVTYAGRGKLYEVELAPEQDEYLLWDKPLSEQSDKVKSAIEELRVDGYDDYGNLDGEGGDIYKAVEERDGAKEASEYLRSLGIRGIKYLDGSSRAKGEGAYNYVIFDDKDIDIKAKFSRDSKGKPLPKSFFDWFGDSKVVDDQGRPLVVYHGTSKDIEVFEPDSGKGKTFGTGSFFSSNPLTSNTYTGGINNGNVLPVYLSMQNPAVFDAKGANWNRINKDARVTLPKIDGSTARNTTLGRFMPSEFKYVDDYGSTDDLARWARQQGYDGLIIKNVRDQGPTGNFVTEESGKPGTIYVAYKANQVKSATGNNGDFSKTDNRIQFSKQEIENTLIAQHNLTIRNLIHADRMGGLAAPSIAVTDKAHPLTGFGEITLLSTKDMVDPKNGTKIFGSDIYSPRYPSISYDFSGKPIKALNNLLADGVKATGDSEYYNDGLENDPFRELQHSSAAMYQFLSEQGETPDIKFIEPKALPDPRLEKFVDSKLDSFDLSNDAEFKATAKEVFSDKSDRESIDEQGLGYITRDYAGQVVSHRDAIRDAGKVDRTATNSRLFRQISDSTLRNKFDEYLVDLVNKSEPKERIFKGYTNAGNRQYMPHDIDTVIKILKKDLRGGENFKYGLGSIRAKYSPQFKSIEQIRKSKGMLMDSESFDRVKKEVQTGLDDLNESLSSYGTFSGYDNVETMLSDVAKRGINGALKDNGFENVPDSIKVDIQTFLNKLKDMPTEYFEAKLLRAVGLGEFSTAIIPDDATPQVEAILKKNGIEDIRKYKAGDKEDRVKQINSVTHVMFSRAPKLYSKLEQALESANDKVFSTGQQVKLWLQGNAGKLGIKKDEVYWSGIENWLDAQGKVDKQRVVEFVRNNGVKVEDVTLGGDKEFNTIRDKLDRLLLDELEDRPVDKAEQSALERRLREIKNTEPKHNNDKLTLPGGTDYKELVVTVPTVEKYNQSDDTHFGDTGQGKQIGWLRMNTRDGGLFIEELQSQRAQQGRSKGFGARNVTRYEVLLNGNYWGDFNTKFEADNAVKSASTAAGDFEINEVVTGRLRGVPPAPFVSDANNKATNAYITLLMKKALIEAVSNDHASVSWTTGDQQADRYDLSKQISRITYNKRDGKFTYNAYGMDSDNLVSMKMAATSDEVRENLGKDILDKMINDEGRKTKYGMELSGIDLKIGGEWAQSMYGNEQGLNLQGKPSLMSQAANDVFKHVGSGKIESINGQPGFYITDEMRNKDLPLFSRGKTVTVDGVERPTTNSEGKPINNPVNFWKWFGDDANVDDQGRPKVLYHSTLEDIAEFDSTGEFMGYSGTSGISLTDNRDMASRYLDRFGERRYDGVMFQKNVMPVYAKIGKFIERDEPFRTNVRFGAPLPENYIPAHVKLGYDTVIRNDSINRKGSTVKHSDAKNALRGKEYIIYGTNRIKSAIGNNGDYSLTNNDIRFSFAGPKAETADKYALETAQRRIAAGDDVETVRQGTGWFKGVDDKWRFEINDTDASIKKPFPTKGQRFGDVYENVYKAKLKEGYAGIALGDILDHPKLFAAYPHLEDLSIDTQKGAGASYRVSTSLSPSMIEIGEDVPMFDVLSTLLHEIQHGIQRTEGFAVGGNFESARIAMVDIITKKLKDINSRIIELGANRSALKGDEYLKNVELHKSLVKERDALNEQLESLKYDMAPAANAYKRLAGEVEARNTQTRMGFSDEERRLLPAYSSQDVPDSDQIVVYNGTEMRIEPTPPDETRLRKFQRMNQDSFNRFTVIRDWLAEQGIKLSDKADVYGAEERYHSKAANQLEDFREQQRNPLIERIQKAGYTLGDIEVFLKMQHAQEANEAIRKIGGDTAYGITDEEASEYLTEAPKELATLANELRSITEQTKKLRLDNGILNKDITDAWENAYKHYIPVKGEADAERGIGKGLKTNFKSKRRLGHGLRDEHVIENILTDHERAIMEVEKNRVGKHLVMMAAEMQRPDILSIGKPEKRKVLKVDNAYTVEANGVVQGVFKSRDEAKMFKQLYATTHSKVAPSAITINQTKDQRVIASASPMLADNEVNVYMNGHAIRVQINDELLARAYTKLGVEQFSDIVAAGRALNGYLSKMYTGYNPEFILTNMIRDFSSGTINLTGEQGFKMALKSLANYPKAFGSLLKYAATNGKSSNKWIDSYRANGGNTGAAYLSDMERLGNEVSTEYASHQGVLSNLKQGDNMNAARAAGRKVFNATLKWIYNLNQAGENAMRLAAFKAMIDSGKTVNEAAKVAKNITVNFNRRGERISMPALYLFYNASIQGTAATGHALFKGKHKYQAQALAASMATVGYLVASSFGGGSEDDWDEINDYTKERNLLIKSGDGYAKIPIPYGYGFFYNLGRTIAETQRTGDLGAAPWHLATSAISEFTPFNDVVVGSDGEFKSDQVFTGFLPTALKIAAQPIFNKQLFTGSELMPESQNDKSQPDREKMFRGTKGTMYDEVAGWLESAGLDVSPETLKYIVRTGTGGAGSLVDTTISAAMLKKEGAELDTGEIPFVRKAYMELGIKDRRAAFYKARDEARKAAEEFNRIKRKNDVAKLQEFVDKGHNLELLQLNDYANKVQKWAGFARDEQDAIRADENLNVKEKRLKLKELEAQESEFYKDYLSQ